MKKILTVIVPSYNMEKYLPKCLGSLEVAPELMEKLEVLVVNDGSKDRTSEIAHEFAAKWPGTFKVIDKTNGNYGSCINAALPVASGLYVKVLDADDWFETKAFGKYLRFLESADDADLVLTDYDTVDVNDRVLCECRCGFNPYEIFSVAQFLETGSHLFMHAYAYRTDLFKKLTYRQLEGCSYTDWQWVILPLSVVRRVRYCPLVVYKYLNGRIGQTTDGVQVATNWWMLGEVALDTIRQFALCEFENGDVRGMLLRKICLRVERVYRTGLLDRHEQDFEYLRNFDSRLKELSREVYDLCGDLTYSRFVRYRFVKAWRDKSRWRFIIRGICVSTTRLARAIRGTIRGN